MGSDEKAQMGIFITLVSIHAPRMGSDADLPDLYATRCVSIHAPRMGSDVYMVWRAHI